MRALRIDLTYDRLEDGRPEVLIGMDVTGTSFRYEGEIPGGTTRQLKIGPSQSSLLFRNDSSFFITVTVRDSAMLTVQVVGVASGSEVVIPMKPSGVTVEFLNPDPSLAQITAIIF